jgi:hypothetical protein
MKGRPLKSAPTALYALLQEPSQEKTRVLTGWMRGYEKKPGVLGH